MSGDSTSTEATRQHDINARGFASDNEAGVHPEVLAAITIANEGHQPSYGQDVYTEHLQAIFRRHFGDHAQAWPVFNGSGANVVALQAITERWGAVITTSSAHINLDECGAPERMGGLKLLTVPTSDGKLTPELIDREAWGLNNVHHVQPQVVSITQSTELGTCYTPDEIAAICAHTHQLGLRVHLDGARIANAAASLNLPLRAFTTDAGVDLLSFGGTKNGLLLGEAIVVLHPDVVSGLTYLRKQSMQLASKMRFISAQFDALLAGDLWLRNARQANTMAQRLYAAVHNVPGVEVLYPVQANAVFARLPKPNIARLQQRFSFYVWDEKASIVRWLTSLIPQHKTWTPLPQPSQRLADTCNAQ